MNNQKISLKDLSILTQAKLVGQENFFVCGVNTLEEASEMDASFLANSRYSEAMKKSKAGVICIGTDIKIKDKKNYLVSNDPSSTFQKIILFFLGKNTLSAFEGIHPTAIVHPTALIGKDVTIAPHAVIDAHVKIGDHSFIGPSVFFGPSVTIGKDCIIHANSTVRENCLLGNRVILQPGSVIGSCGFGYTSNEKGEFCKIEQFGNVILEDDVEIGANTVIDRARFKTTKIRRGTKIDNLVQIAHNVEIGEYNAIAAQTGIAGSAKTGKHVLMGGQVGIVGHVTIQDRAMLATRCGVNKNLAGAQQYRGSPVMLLKEYNRLKVTTRQLPKQLPQIKEKLETLSKKIEQIEEKLKTIL